MGIARAVGRALFKGTRYEPFCWEVYDGVRRRVDTDWREIQPGFSEVTPYWMCVDTAQKVADQKVRGEYEREVARTLVKTTRPTDTFWEVGAKYGYYSLLIAQTAEQVIAFEKDAYPASKVRAATQRNGYDNVRVVEGVVGDGVALDTYPDPDVALMDIEGWEQEALESAVAPLQSASTWIIEVHEKGVLDGQHSDVSAIKDRLSEFGYDITRIHEREPGNYHILATR